MKNYRYIEDLLERYYEAQTSKAEEQRLKDFFFNEEVPPHLLDEKKMFLQLQALQVSQKLETKLSKQIDIWAKKELFMRKSNKERHHYSLLCWIGSIAASLLVIFYLGWHSRPLQLRQDTCKTPEEAYLHTEKALLMFAQAINKGVTQMEVIQESSDKVERNIQRQLNKLKTNE